MTTAISSDLDLTAWQCSAPLAPAQHRRIRTDMALNGFKWDAQVGDVCTLAPFAIILPRNTWAHLSKLSESLARELSAAETELCRRRDLWPALGLPRPVRSALATERPWTPTAARVVRFDFHPTRDGWRISEVNSDVPGGYTEASRFTQLMAESLGIEKTAGDPTATLCTALIRSVQNCGCIALLGAAGYVEDQQVIAHIAHALRQRGVETICGTPEQVSWRDGKAHLGTNGSARPVDVVFRFYQGEWMTRLAHHEWVSFFRGGRTPVCNPAAAVLSESKRLPLVWPQLETAMPTWRQLLPDTRAATAAFARPRYPWVLKAAYGNTGDAVVGRSWSRGRDYALALATAAIRPREWIAQESFRNLKLPTPLGAAHVCLGVYVIDGVACGIYGRLSPGDFIDYQAIDTAILIGN